MPGCHAMLKFTNAFQKWKQKIHSLKFASRDGFLWKITRPSLCDYKQISSQHPFFYYFTALLLIIIVAGCRDNRKIEPVSNAGVILTVQEKDWLKTHPVVTIALDKTNPPLSFIRQDVEAGSYSGASIDYMNLIAQKTGLNMKFKGDVWSAVLKDAMDHKVDGLMGASIREERKKKLNFTESYLEIANAMATRKNYPEVRNIADFSGRRVAVNKNAIQEEVIKNRCPGSIIVEVNSVQDGIKKVRENKVDGFFGEMPAVKSEIETTNSNVKISLLYYYSEAGAVRVALRNNAPELLSIFNKGIAAITPAEHELTRERWLGSVNNVHIQRDLPLTVEEQAWLDAHHVINVATDSARKPLSWQDKNGEFNGIAIDYLHRYEELLGVRFKISDAEQFSSMDKTLHDGRIDIFASRAVDNYRQESCIFTTPFVTSPMVILASSNQYSLGGLAGLANKRVVVLSDSLAEQVLKRNCPQVQIRPVKKVNEAMTLISRGEADVYLGSLIATTQQIIESGNTDFRVVDETGYEYKFAMAVRKDYPILVQILNKASAAIPIAEKDAIRYRWSSIPVSPKIDSRLIYILLAVVLVAVVFILQLRVMVRRRTAELEKEVEARRANEERLRLATLAGNIGVWDWDIVSDNLSWGDSMYALYGIDKDDFSGAFSAWSSTLYPDDRQYCVEEIQASLRGEREYKPEFRIVKPDGEIRIIKATSHIIFSKDGEAIRMIGTNVDITERKQVEIELEQHHTHLEELVGMRTIELEMAKVTAEKANKAKSMFLANMSHELRTPLNAIIGFSQVISQDITLPAKLQDNMRVILKSGEHLLSLINDILDLARIESGKTVFEPVEFDLGSLITDVIDMLRMRARDKGLNLVLDQSSSFPRFVQTDPGKLRHILINLIGNAIKFTQKGTISIKLAVLSRHNGTVHHELHFAVSDTGVGISDEDLKRIFKPFEQVSTSVYREGTGLGLSIAMEYVKLLNGSIAVESELGKGSTFKFTVAYEPVEGASAPALHVSKGCLEKIENAEKIRILIVEDHLENRALLVALLTPYWFQIREVENGADAIEMVKEWQPHLVFMDRRMPVMDGITATAEIRKLKLADKPVIIAITAHAYTEEREEMMDSGCDGFIAKPFRDEEVYTSIGKYLPVNLIYNNVIEEIAISPTMDKELLMKLSDAARQQISKAAFEGDGQTLRELLTLYPEANELLLPLVDGYRFDFIVDKFKEIL